MLEDKLDSTPEYGKLFDSIKGAIEAARSRAAQQANSTLIELHWQIGQLILQRQQEQGWGSKVIDRLAVDLRMAYPDMRGLGRRNLHDMRAMAEAWPPEFVQQLLHKLAWGHVTVILNSCEGRATRDFYVQRAVAQGWTRAVLETMIASRLHERERATLTTFDRTIPERDRESVQQLVKDPYVLDFLESGTAVPERDLRKALVTNLLRLLQELGSGFAFLGTEIRLEVGGDEFFIDLLFYHVRLHRYVVFELKVGAFQPEYVGKLNFYVQVVDGEMRDLDRDEPTIGILLVVNRNDVVVEYALRGLATPLAVSTVRALPDEIRHELPSAQELGRAVVETMRSVEPDEKSDEP
jgi:predicted nuclease of restriction endonuclease-like (RecB) superfamily